MSSINIFKGIYIRNSEIRTLMKKINLLINDNTESISIPDSISKDLINENEKNILDLARISKKINEYNQMVHAEAVKMMNGHKRLNDINEKLLKIIKSVMASNESIEDKHTKVFWEDKRVLSVIDDDYDYTKIKRRKRQ